MMKASELSGNSGCQVELYNSKNGTFVRKFSGSLQYNERLKKQCTKQREFKSVYFDKPCVIGEGYSNGFYWFDMEYISGITLSKYMQYVRLSEIPGIVDIFKKIMPSTNVYDADAKSHILNKLEDLSSKIKESKYLKYIIYLKNCNWNYVMNSSCHGDFTLENMIVSKGKIFLIDFLDSFYDSWMIDFAKILQDVELGWSYRYIGMDVNLKIRLLSFKKSLIDIIQNMKDGTKIIQTIYQFLLLNLIRIVPYIKDDVTKKFIDKSLDYVLLKLEAVV